ncbi:alcohol dehydrogenase [Apiospora arundinis]|uniref:Alcohol dehydrogenase n=1 Tax=Apiospora arundinis TaxID=335852 RepID=A0ABR2HRS2_9PEZI
MSGLEILDVPVPDIQDPKQMLIKMHAAGFATGDANIIAGKMKTLVGDNFKFPLRAGITGSGTVVKVGKGVTAFKPGDAVYGMAFSRPLKFNPHPGYASEYAIGREDLFLLKPAALSFEAAAAAFGATVTAYQSLELGLRLLREQGVQDGLEGKTVFVPGALSATGNIGVQMLKHVYGAGRVISTVSTAKMPLVRDRLPPGTVDELIDYQKTPRLADVVTPGSVDFTYGTQWTLEYIKVMEKRRGVIVSIAALFPAQLFREVLGDILPFWFLWVASLAQLYYRWRLRGTSIKMGIVSGNPGVREDVERVGEILATGKIQPVMTVVEMEDIEAVREAADKVQKIKGGIGGLVIKIA